MQWQRVYLEHSRSPRWQRRYKMTLEWLYTHLADRSDVYVSFSGGKDSLAILALLSELGLFLPVMTQADDLDWPAKRAFCLRVVPQLGFTDYEYLDAPESAVAQLGSKRRLSVAELFLSVVDAYAKRRGMNGVILGLRKQESNARRMNRAVRGLSYRTKSMHVFTPLGDWTGMDVMALHTVKQTPLFFIYTIDHPIPPHQRRMSWPIFPELLRHGQGSFVKYVDVGLWNRLVEAAPWLAAEVC